MERDTETQRDRQTDNEIQRDGETVKVRKRDGEMRRERLNKDRNSWRTETARKRDRDKDGQ